MDIPPFVREAFEIVGFETAEQRYVEAFQRRWGGFGPDALRQAVEQGSREEQLEALLMLGCGVYQEGVPTLMRFLQSTDDLERWAATIALGMMKDERVLIALIKVVTEFLPNPLYTREGSIEWRFEHWRWVAVRTLEVWGRSELKSRFVEMVKVFWLAEQDQGVEIPPLVRKEQVHLWKNCEKELVYALGEMEAFEEVMLLESLVPVTRFAIWRVYSIFGFLHMRERCMNMLVNLSGRWDDPVLQQHLAETAEALREHFRLSEEEAQGCLEAYKQEWNQFFDTIGWDGTGDEKMEERYNTFGTWYAPQGEESE